MNYTEVSTRTEFTEEACNRSKTICNSILEMTGKDNWEISLLICGDDEIRSLNKLYRNIDSATDVLSFPQEDQFPGHDRCYAGDIIVSVETARRQAREEGISVDDVLKRLYTHGILHLAGFVHNNDEEYSTMKTKEEQILSGLKGERIL